MQTTTNYGLKKPAQTDDYNIDDQNINMDIIDQELKANADSITLYTADSEYQSPTIVGTQIQLQRLSNTKRLFFKLDEELSSGGGITVSLDGGLTDLPLKDINGNNVNELSKGFVEVVEDTTNFTLRSSNNFLRLSNTTITRTVENDTTYGSVNIKNNDTVYFTNTGQVKKTGVKPITTGGSTAIVSGVTNTIINTTTMDSNRAILIYTTGSGGSLYSLYARVIQQNNDGSLSQGNLVFLEQNGSQPYGEYNHAVRIDDNNVLVVYWSSSGSIKGAVITISGVTITGIGVHFTLVNSASSSSWKKCIKIDENKYALHYMTSTSGTGQYAKGFTLNGNALNQLGTQFQISTKNVQSHEYLACTSTNINTILCVYEAIDTNFGAYMRVATFNGVELDTLGIEVFLGTGTGLQNGLETISIDKALYGFNVTSVGYAQFMIINIIGTTPSFINISTLIPPAVSLYPKNIYKLRENVFVISANTVGSGIINSPTIAKLTELNKLIFSYLLQDTSSKSRKIIPLTESIGFLTENTNSNIDIKPCAFVSDVVHGIAKNNASAGQPVDVRLIL